MLCVCVCVINNNILIPVINQSNIQNAIQRYLIVLGVIFLFSSKWVHYVPLEIPPPLIIIQSFLHLS